MPNWITNKLKVIGTKEQIHEVLDFIKDEEQGYGTIDFNKIIPMPDGIFMGNVGPEEQKKYGENNWYDWSLNNWGTKWNASSTSNIKDGSDTIYFDTAWSNVYKIITKLSFLFPNVTLDYIWYDEDMGSNLGNIIVNKGKIISKDIPEDGSKEAYEFYFRESGESPEDNDLIYSEKEGTYVYNDEDEEENDEGNSYPCSNDEE